MEKEPNMELLTGSTIEMIFEQDTEINLFFNNLFKRDFKAFRDLIYKYFPELTDIHTNPNNLSEDELRSKIEDTIKGFREKYTDNIKLAEDNIMAKLPEIEEGIKSLEDLMGETEHFNYLIMPSVYPVCPFDVSRNLFYFSITNVKDGITEFNRLSSTALHEISHFIFFRQIAKIPNKLSDRGIHHLKEVLTPVLLQHPDIITHRKEKYICGNNESIDYQVEVDGEIMSIFNYVNSEFQKNPTPEGYLQFLYWLIDLFEQMEPEILNKDLLHAKNGRAVFSDPVLKTEFMKPIKLTNKK
jgi:hypothetical protein